MHLEILGPDFTRSWTIALQSHRFHEFMPGTPYPAFGIALLFYHPERHLSISVWNTKGARNIWLWGPRKLSWER